MFQYFPIFDLTIKKSRSTQWYRFNNLGSIGVPDATYQVQNLRSIGSSAENFKVFYHIWVWRPFWLCDLDGLIIFLFSSPLEA